MKMHVSRAIALVLIASAPLAWGQQQRLSFEYLDTDKDGSLSKEEVATFAGRIPSKPNPEEVFARWDTDKDGKVSKHEFEARPRGAGVRNRQTANRLRRCGLRQACRVRDRDGTLALLKAKQRAALYNATTFHEGSTLAPASASLRRRTNVLPAAQVYATLPEREVKSISSVRNGRTRHGCDT